MPKPKGDGGPAFPTENERQTGNSSYHYQGMSLRDYFAAKAMEALISQWMRLGQGMLPKHDYSEIAKESYEMSDAMLKAREVSDA